MSFPNAGDSQTTMGTGSNDPVSLLFGIFDKALDTAGDIVPRLINPEVADQRYRDAYVQPTYQGQRTITNSPVATQNATMAFGMSAMELALIGGAAILLVILAKRM